MTFSTPRLPNFSGAFSRGLGASVLLWLEDHTAAHVGDVLIDVVSLRISVGSQSRLVLDLLDASGATANLTMDADCTSRLTASGAHLVGVILDGAARVLMFSVDGAVCDGGDEAIAGWAWALSISDLWPNARRSFALGGSKGFGAYGGSIVGGQWIARAVRNSEAVAAWRFGAA